MEVSANTVDSLYYEMWNRIKTSGIKQNSRNGPVISIPEPVTTTLHNPTQRVLHSPVRDCNPFFHMAEVVWMFAGSQDVKFVERFNRRYREYADENTDIVWGAYGHRWLQHWDFDQVQMIIGRLLTNLEDRQCVINMWDPIADLPPMPIHADRPCNTQLMFRVIDYKLHMLVVNRSNDMVWGALGANVVHFTYLQEVIATACGFQLGSYRVVTNNLHVYPEMPRYDELYESGTMHDRSLHMNSYPVLHEGEDWEDLRNDCIRMVNLGQYAHCQTLWGQWVAAPMLSAYLAGPVGNERSELVLNIRDDNWRTACMAWMGRRSK